MDGEVSEGAGCLCIVFELFLRGDSSAKKKNCARWPPPLHPSLFRGNRLPAPFCLPPSPAFPLSAHFLLFSAFCMEVAIWEDYPVWGLLGEEEEKRIDTVAWVLILTQGRSEDMGSVSNQEFPGWVTQYAAFLVPFFFFKLDNEVVLWWTVCLIAVGHFKGFVHTRDPRVYQRFNRSLENPDTI